jgi:hypothetical protein
LNLKKKEKEKRDLQIASLAPEGDKISGKLYNFQ